MSELRCFVIMPFDSSFDDVYAAIKVSVAGAVEGETIACRRLDEIKTPGRISADLVRELDLAAVCIADATGLNPNVMWEVGYAMALKKPLILISQDLSTLPFDLKDYRTIGYSRTSLAGSLSKRLRESVRDTLGEHVVRRAALEPFITPLSAGTIAVTGSMDCDRVRCVRRVQAVLTPYLGRGIRWLCGSYGLADEVALEFLVLHDENVTVVGFHAYDISDGLRQLLEKHRLPFVDARREQIPKLATSPPSERDALFLAKSDLVILLWNGQSEGTRKLIGWFQEAERDHVVAFM